jgi:hypothetical protein
MKLSEIIKKIYIIHYIPLIDRKNYLVSYFNKTGITNFEFRTLYQRENLKDELKNSYFKLDNLNPSQVCITIEHIETYREIIKNSINDNDWYLILEDDAIFYDNFIENINTILEDIPDDAEYLDISDYFTIESNNLWEKKHTTRTTCAYLINKKTCEKLLTTIIPFNKAIDHELNTQFQIHDMKVYWSSKSLVNHGSGNVYRGSYIYY